MHGPTHRLVPLAAAAALIAIAGGAARGHHGAVPEGQPAQARPALAAAEEPPDQVVLGLPLALGGRSTGPARFALEVLPPRITNSVPAQRCVFLVLVRNLDWPLSAAPVALTASAPGATVEITPALAPPGTIAELTVVPDPASAESTLPILIRGQRDGLELRASTTLDVLADMPGLDEERGATAAEMLQPFLPWLAEQHPELGITPETAWRRTVVTPQILVVMHYLFFSEEWEVHVAWHVMIPPYDWTRIDLRRRFGESRPSRAFEISSRGGQTAPIAIDPPEDIWR